MNFYEFQDAEKGGVAFQTALDENIIMSVTDEEGIIVYANSKFCEVSQYSASELVGQSHSIINSGLHDAIFFKELWRTIRSGKMWHGEIRNKAKDGSLYWVDTVIVPVIDNFRHIQYFLSLRTVVTGKKEAEIALTDAIFNLSHYIRNPLVNMQALLTICRAEDNLSNNQAIMASHMQAELNKIDNLTRKMIEDLHLFRTKLKIR